MERTPQLSKESIIPSRHLKISLEDFKNLNPQVQLQK